MEKEKALVLKAVTGLAFTYSHALHEAGCSPTVLQVVIRQLAHSCTEDVADMCLALVTGAADPVLAAMRACVDGAQAGVCQGDRQALDECLCEAAKAGQATCLGVAILAALLAESDVLFASGALRDLGRHAATVCAGLSSVQWASQQMYTAPCPVTTWDADLPFLVAAKEAGLLVSGQSLLRAMCRVLLAGKRDANVSDVLVFLTSEGGGSCLDDDSGNLTFEATSPIAQFLFGTRQVRPLLCLCISIYAGLA